LKAVVKMKRGISHVRLLNVEKPKPALDEVLVEVKAAGICGTDIHIYHDRAFYRPPVTLGHEYSGIITAKGRAVKDFKVGERVTSPATIPCGECPLCQTGSPNRCIGKQRRILGALKADGAFAKYMKVPARILHRIPDGLPFEEAAVAEPVACAVHAVAERTGINIGDTVLILGPGPMGLLALQVAKAEGASQVMITGVGSDEGRLKIAKSLGADLTLNAEEENLFRAAMDLTDGIGVDVVIEASGAPVAQKQALELVRRRGRVGIIGLSGRPVELELDKVVEGELDVAGSWGTVWTSWRKALILMAEGKVKTKPLITQRLPIEEWRTGFKLMEEREALKVLLKP